MTEHPTDPAAHRALMADRAYFPNAEVRAELNNAEVSAMRFSRLMAKHLNAADDPQAEMRRFDRRLARRRFDEGVLEACVSAGFRRIPDGTCRITGFMLRYHDSDIDADYLPLIRGDRARTFLDDEALEHNIEDLAVAIAQEFTPWASVSARRFDDGELMVFGARAEVGADAEIVANLLLSPRRMPYARAERA